MAQDDPKKKAATFPESVAVAGGESSGDGTVDPDAGEGPADEPDPDQPAPDPVGEAERELQKAKNKLADAKDKAKRDEEIGKAVKQYEAVQVDLEADQDALTEHRREEMDKLAPSQAEIAKVTEVRDGLLWTIDDLRTSTEARAEALKEKKADLADKKDRLARSKEGFEKRKAQVKLIQDKHRGADAVRKEAIDARLKQKRHLAFYLLEHKLGPATDGEPNPIEFGAYVEAINAESADYGSLNRTIGDLEAEIKEDEARLAQDEKKLADLEKGFEATIREKLSALS